MARLSKYRTETDKLTDMMHRAAENSDVQGMLVTADELLRRQPDNADAMYVAGTAMIKGSQEGLGALVLNAARCATKDPAKLGAIWNNLGWALENYQPDEAYKCFVESLKYGEAPPGTYGNLCAVASTIGRHAEALTWAKKAEGYPTDHNEAFALLHLGRWAEAWAHYKHSVGSSARPRTERTYDLPRWDGKKKGKVIIHGEQGVGDEIMFMSMVPADFDGVIDCSPRMEGLFQRSFPKAKVYGTLLQDYLEWPLEERADYHIEMGGLGEYFAQTPFARGGFLRADSARCAAWRAWLDAAAIRGLEEVRLLRRDRESIRSGAVRVGISWTGGAWSTGRAKRSVPFDLIAKLIEQHPNVTWVNLEYEDRRDELKDFPQVLNPYWATKKGADMDDLAALCASLDLIITATNSTVDVAGALGVPVWAMVPHNPPWRYSDLAAPAGADSMWFYESVRTFRQRGDDDGSWDRVVKTVANALGQKLTAQKPANGHDAPANDDALEGVWHSC